MKKKDDINEEVKEENITEENKTNEQIEIIKMLSEQNEQLNEKILRSNAELQNYRKRKDDEVERLLKYSEEGIILEILPIIDNFERAIKFDDNTLDDELSKFLQGFKMIYSGLINILNNNEVTEIESLDKQFDPTYHQAVLTDNISELEDNIVLEVLQKGYMYKDRVIRPSMVKVNNK